MAKRKRRRPGSARPVTAPAASEPSQPAPRRTLWVIAGVALLAFGVVVAPRWRHAQSPAATHPHAEEVPDRVESLRVHVLAEHPHDPQAFTQGLQWFNGTLYEGTGLEGHSQLRRVRLQDWSVEQRVALPNEVFGEGIAVTQDRIVEITWQQGIAYVWNRHTFERVGEFHYTGEGWGLCFDGESLVMSDGSSRLVWRNPTTFEVTRQVQVRRRGTLVDQLNELECVDGVVYANIWQTDNIARIDAHTGRVTAWIDASGLLTDAERVDADVLNGITWLPDARRFLITGKLWPRSFEVEFVTDERATAIATR